MINPNRNTKEGFYVELQVHYLAYLLGDKHAEDGAYMGDPALNADWTAWASEIIAKAIRALPVVKNLI